MKSVSLLNLGGRNCVVIFKIKDNVVHVIPSDPNNPNINIYSRPSESNYLIKQNESGLILNFHFTKLKQTPHLTKYYRIFSNIFRESVYVYHHPCNRIHLHGYSFSEKRFSIRNHVALCTQLRCWSSHHLRKFYNITS